MSDYPESGASPICHHHLAAFLPSASSSTHPISQRWPSRPPRFRDTRGIAQFQKVNSALLALLTSYHAGLPTQPRGVKAKYTPDLNQVSLARLLTYIIPGSPLDSPAAFSSIFLSEHPDLPSCEYITLPISSSLLIPNPDPISHLSSIHPVTNTHRLVKTPPLLTTSTSTCNLASSHSTTSRVPPFQLQPTEHPSNLTTTTTTTNHLNLVD